MSPRSAGSCNKGVEEREEERRVSLDNELKHTVGQLEKKEKVCWQSAASETFCSDSLKNFLTK